MRITTFISICFIFQSCAWLGSKAVIRNQPTQKIKNVAVIIAQDAVFETSRTDGEYFYVTKILAEELAKKKIFKFTILDKKISAGSLDQLGIGLLGTELMSQYDAYLICIPKARGRNYKVELMLSQTNPVKELIYATHNTGMGNSYTFYQNSTILLNDATRGALDIMEKRWKKMNALN